VGFLKAARSKTPSEARHVCSISIGKPRRFECCPEPAGLRSGHCAMSHTCLSSDGENGKSACETWTDAPTTEAAGLGCIGPWMLAVGAGLWRGGNWALHAGIFLGSACTCDCIETAGAHGIVHVPCPLCPACLCSRVESVASGATALSETHATAPETLVHSNVGLTLCACLVLFILCVCVLESSVLPLSPLRCWKRMQQRRKRMLRCRCMRWSMQPAACVRVPCAYARLIGMFVHACRFCQAC